MAKMYESKQVLKTLSRLLEIPEEYRVRALAAVSRLETVDAEPVKHGRWLVVGNEWIPLPEPKKKTHKICLEGCDDETEFEMECTDEELAFLLRVASKANNTSYYGCMPRLLIDDEEVKEYV